MRNVYQCDIIADIVSPDCIEEHNLPNRQLEIIFEPMSINEFNIDSCKNYIRLSTSCLHILSTDIKDTACSDVPDEGYKLLLFVSSINRIIKKSIRWLHNFCSQFFMCVYKLPLTYKDVASMNNEQSQRIVRHVLVV